MRIMFTKEERSTFKYWFAHWCAFQMTALNHRMWKFKYLFHDIEKPWLKLFWEYPKVQKWHREHNKHHLEYGKIYGWDKVDWEAMAIDWECSHYTKFSQPLLAVEELERQASKDLEIKAILYLKMSPVLIKYGFDEYKG